MLIPSLPSMSSLIRTGGPDISTEERHVWAHDVVDSHKHLLGQHTVKLSPISTARLNPAQLSFCLAPPHNEVLIPILFNNSHPNSIAYSISALGDKSPSKTFTLQSKELTKIEQRWRDYFHDASLTKSGRLDSDPYDPEYENDDYNSGKTDQAAKKGGRGRIMGSSDKPPKLPLSPLARRFYSTPLESTQSITHISVTRPGVVTLVDVKASDNSGFRISGPEVLVVACPTARFEVPKDLPAPKARECAGTEKELAIVAEGVAPLKLNWHREINGRRESFVAEGIEGNPDATNLPLSQNITIPVALSLSSLGKHRYAIDSLMDGAGNFFEPSLRPVGSVDHIARSVEVIGRSSATFKNCGLASPVDLRKGGDATLVLALSKGERLDSVKSVTVQYVPPMGFKASPYTKEYRPKTSADGELPIVVKQPGTYTIMSVDGHECSGDVMSPEVCKVVEQPLPTADVKLETLHECSGDVGVKASLVLHGTPPYTIFYTEGKNRENPREHQRRINSARDEIVFQPESSGTYTYTFTHVSDKYYHKVPLTGEGRSIRKIVHPLASADFVRSYPSRGQDGKPSAQMNSCSGKTVEFAVDLRGTPPWSLKLQVAGPAGAKIIEESDLTESRSRLSVPIPEEVDAEGGMFQIDLVSVVDANRCERSLNVPGIPVNVQRLRPEVKFYSSDGQRHITILEGQIASLPLRLTGQAPWTLNYRRTGDERTQTATLRNPNDYLSVQRKGEYELVDVRDANCPGMVIPMEKTYTVDWVPQPTAKFDVSAGLAAKNNSIIRQAVCEGTEDYAEIKLSGRPPFQISYAYISDNDKRAETHTLSSVQTSARLQLRTSFGGHHRYQLLAIGDVSYPLKAGQQPQGSAIIRGEYLEQTVSTRPTAYFRSPSRLSYCVGNSLSSRVGHGDGGIVVLNGQAPFHLTLSIKNFANNHVVRKTVEVKEHAWKVDFPDYSLDTIGPTLVTIESMKDSSPCPEADPSSLLRQIWIDVAETAAVVPLDRKEDYCVGEPISLQLEGTPPWTVHYAFNGKVREATSSFSKFSRVAVEPGLFKVLTIAHQRNMCQTELENLSMRVHQIPSARVSHGRSVEDNIREGDQATISFELLGTPPFTFTYQRTELMTPEKRGKPLQVLETHTVSGVTSHTYSISSSNEGTWTVTFIADKYCRYPTNPPDSSIESA